MEKNNQQPTRSYSMSREIESFLEMFEERFDVLENDILIKGSPSTVFCIVPRGIEARPLGAMGTNCLAFDEGQARLVHEVTDAQRQVKIANQRLEDAQSKYKKLSAEVWGTDSIEFLEGKENETR